MHEFCQWCGEEFNVNDQLIGLAERPFHPACLEDYLVETERDSYEFDGNLAPKQDIDGGWTRYVDEWPAEVADENTLRGWDDDYAAQYDYE